MKVENTPLPGVKILTPNRFGDERGFFSESWNRRVLAEAGIEIDFVQDNHSLSMAVNTVRGLHYQSPPAAQDKLVRCGKGRLFDVAVDVRKGSPTYGQWFGVELSFENGKQLLVPKGFLHGFATREPETEIIYKCSDYYSPECDGPYGMMIRISGWSGGSPVMPYYRQRMRTHLHWLISTVHSRGKVKRCAC